MAFPLTNGESAKAFNDFLVALQGGSGLIGNPTNIPIPITNNNGSAPIPPAASQSEISWPAVYFSIASIALNVLAQPSSNVCGIRCPQPAYLRISPFVCGWDACIKLCQLLYYSFREGPLNAALRIKGTNEDDNELETHNTDHDSAHTDGAKNGFAMLRLFLFLLGLVIPAVKIFASSNIPWPQAFVGMYLLSYATTELIEYLSVWRENSGTRSPGLPVDHGRIFLESHTVANPAWKSWRGPWCCYIDLPAKHINFKMCLGHVSVIAHVILLGWAFKQIGYGTRRRFDLVALVVGETCTCLLFGYQYFQKDEIVYTNWLIKLLRRFLRIPALVIMVATMVFLISYFGPAYAGRTTYNELVPNKITEVLLGYVICGANASSFGLLLLLQIKEHVTFLRAHFYFLFCWVTFVLSLLYYRFAYDPTGTSTNSFINWIFGS